LRDSFTNPEIQRKLRREDNEDLGDLRRMVQLVREKRDPGNELYLQYLKYKREAQPPKHD